MNCGKVVVFACALVSTATANGQQLPETLLLKDYDPVSIYRIPVTEVKRAKFPVIDIHSHPYAKTDAEIAEWIKNMDAARIEKTIILSGVVGPEFDKVYRKFAKYPGRFEVWCGLLFEGYDKPG